MRFGPGQRITAVVSVWHAPGAEAVVDVVRRLDATVHAWSVTERVPLVPPSVPDGERTPALANIAFLRRPDSMAHEDWLRYWLEEHTQVAIDTQGTFGYLQHPVLTTLTPDAPGTPEIAGIVEELFPPEAVSDHHAFYGSGGDEAEFRRRFKTLMASCARFGADEGLDLVPSSRYCFDLSQPANGYFCTPE